MLRPLTTMASLRSPLMLRPLQRLALSSRNALPSSSRAISTTLSLQNEAVKKPSMSSISAIRKAVPGTSMVKAKEALIASWENSAPKESVEAALQWLEQDRARTGAKKAEKLAGREAKEGLVGVWIDADGLVADNSGSPETPQPPEAAIVELKCETDFVARNEVFVKLLKDLSNTAAQFQSLALGDPASQKDTTSKGPQLVDIPWEDFKQSPVSPVDASAHDGVQSITVERRVLDVIDRLGEKITVGRIGAIRHITSQSRPADDKPVAGELKNELFLASTFTHGSVPAPPVEGEKSKPGMSFACGKVASLLVTHFKGPSVEQMRANKDVINALGRCLARQSVGLDTKTIQAAQGASVEQGDPESTSLYSQPFMMLLPTAQVDSTGEESVQSVLQKWADKHASGGSVEVKHMMRWSLSDQE